MRAGIAVVCVCCLVIAGCGGLESPTSTGRRSLAPTVGGMGGLGTGASGVGSVHASEAKYSGWDSLKLTNGLVTVVAVPSIGGRIMEYKLGGHPFLWVNPEEQGKVHEAAQPGADRTWHNYGGYKAWPAPQKQWGGPPDPPGSALDGGKWTGQIVPGERGAATLRLTSPKDATVTGLQITREVTLYGGTTRLVVKERFTNVADKPITWSVWDVTQVPGSLSKREQSSSEARIYFPLNSNSAYAKGFHEITEGGAAQWIPNVAPGIIGVKYLGQRGKIGADSLGGWIAYVDEAHEFCYAKRFGVEKLGKYPDQGSTVEVFCSDTDSYMEVEVLSPLTTIAPGDSYAFTVEWYAARCGGPIVECTEVGVTKDALALADDRGRTVLKGTFGVFLPGTVQVVFQDSRGGDVSRTGRIAASPEKALELNQAVAVPQDAARVALELLNDAGTPVGTLATLDLEGDTIARATARPRREG